MSQNFCDARINKVGERAKQEQLIGLTPTEIKYLLDED
jgi:hypothetical protein